MSTTTDSIPTSTVDPDRVSDTLKWIVLAVIFITTVVAGILPLKVMSFITAHRASSSRILSLLSCFAGGIFLSVCMLDMIPDAMENFDDWKANSGKNVPDFPWVLLAACLGFWLIYFMEGVMHRLCADSDHHCDMNDVVRARTLTTPSKHNPFACDADAVVPRTPSPCPTSREQYVKSLTFVGALLLHVSLEGFALGEQEKGSSEVSLFAGVIVHKTIVIFSIGIRLFDAHPDGRGFVIGLIVLLAAAPVAAGAIGIILQDAAIDAVLKALLCALLNSLSAGVFLYITFFEILGVEEGTLPQRFAAILGFLLIAIVIFFTS